MTDTELLHTQFKDSVLYEVMPPRMRNALINGYTEDGELRYRDPDRGLTYLDIVTTPKGEFLRLRNFGHFYRAQLEKELAAIDLSLEMELV